MYNAGLPMIERLTHLLRCMWRKEAYQQEFNDASIIQLYKRHISFPSVARNILANVLLNRLKVQYDQAVLIPVGIYQ